MSGEIQVVQPTPEERATWDKRADGSQKGLGYFGLMKRPDGQVSSELSIGVNLGGKEMEIPAIVPTLTRDELQHLLGGGEPTPEIVRKASDFAARRMQGGQSPFAGEGEQLPLPEIAQPQPAQPGLINRAMQGIKDFNLFDTLHPQGTGSTQRGFNNIYPKP